MCLSAEVDLLAGAVIGVIAIDGMRHVRHREQLLLAAIPVTLGAHQLVEAIVWWSLEGRVSSEAGQVAVWAYLLIALVLIPLLVPAAVVALEPPSTRRRLGLFTVVGAAVALVFGLSLWASPLGASIEGRHVAYDIDLWWGPQVAVLYVLATCGSLLGSAHGHIRRFGAVNLVAAVGFAWLNEDGLISLWCFWAAVTSVAIAAELRFNARSTPNQVPSPSAPVR